MKEASGELSMTLITIIAVGAILLIIGVFKEPIFNFIESKWNTFTGGEGESISDPFAKNG